MNAIPNRLVIALAGAVVAAEEALAQLFRSGDVRDTELRALLTEEQVKRYDTLRGYSSGSPHQHRKH